MDRKSPDTFFSSPTIELYRKQDICGLGLTVCRPAFVRAAPEINVFQVKTSDLVSA